MFGIIQIISNFSQLWVVFFLQHSESKIRIAYVCRLQCI